MTAWKSVGRSRYKGDTNGVEQFLQEHAASRILDLIEIVARQPGCRRMTVNEGRRTRPRQDDLWRRWRNGTGYLAAVPYTSRHDEVRHGNAADLGGPDGEALNLAERAAISRFGPAIGVHFTGLTFRPVEPWHVEADETPYTRRYGTTAPAGGTAVPIESEEDDDLMFHTLIFGKTTGGSAPYLLDHRDGKRRRLGQNEVEVLRLRVAQGSEKVPEMTLEQSVFDGYPKKPGSL